MLHSCQIAFRYSIVYKRFYFNLIVPLIKLICLQHIPKENTLILSNEQLKRYPIDTLRTILQFTNLSSFDFLDRFESITTKEINCSSTDNIQNREHEDVLNQYVEYAVSKNFPCK